MATRKEIEDAKAKKAAAAKKTDAAQKGQVRLEFNQAQTGLNMDSTINQVKTGSLTYALNATVENFDSSSVNYQNEPGNEPCLTFPEGFELIGKYTIAEKKKNIFFLTNPATGSSEIGFQFNNDCQYQTLVKADCLNFNINYPIHKVVHRITNCTTEIYWTDGLNPRRYLDIDNIPYKLIFGDPSCDPVYSDELDCNQLKIQPNFSIPQLKVEEVVNLGSLVAGTYQFAIQYADASGNDLTSYYSVTNPCPIADPLITSVNFNYPVGKSVQVSVSNLDLTGQFQYFNLAVIKTVNDISSVELVGTYNITEASKEIIYTGSDASPIQLSISDIFEKYPYYSIAQDLTSVQDTLIWSNLTSIDRINYQKIANLITLQWETYRLPPGEDYANEANATNLRGYMRDEVYAFDIVFLLRNGKQTDSFHIPGTTNHSIFPDVPDTNDDFIGEPDYSVGDIGYSPYWKIYNNATNLGYSPGADTNDVNYKGPWQHGQFAYWESTEEYPCNEDVWGDLAGNKIRHHKFPDVLVSPIIQNGEVIYNGDGQIMPVMQDNALFPIGVKVDNDQIASLINTSNLTDDEKDDIVGYKIVRGSRDTNKSVIAKGLLRNVNKYNKQDQEYYYPNYPYNQVEGEDPFIQENNNAWTADTKSWLIYMPESNPRYIWPGYPAIDIEVNAGEEGVFAYTSVSNGRQVQAKIKVGCVLEICSPSRPVALQGIMTIGPGDYDVWNCNGGKNWVGCGWRLNWYNPFNRQNLDQSIYKNKWMTTGGGQYTYGTVITEAYDGEDSHPFKPWDDDHANFAGFDCASVRIGLLPYDPNGELFTPIDDNGEGGDYIGPVPDYESTEAADCLGSTGEPGFGFPHLPTPALVPECPIDNSGEWFQSGCDSLLGCSINPDPGSQEGWLDGDRSRPQSRRSGLGCDREFPMPVLGDDAENVKKVLKSQVFSSPDTSFGQPFLGQIMKLESVLFGGGKAHFVEVEDNAKYKLLSKEAQEDALKSSEDIAAAGSVPWDAAIMFTVYQSYLTIYVNGITRRNYAQSFNSQANYDYSFPIDNNVDGGIKQRQLETARYLIPGVQSIYPNDPPVNNWNRESSVYLKTKEEIATNNTVAEPFLLPHKTPSLIGTDGNPTIVEYSRFTIGGSGACDKPEKEQDIKVVSYYGSMKNFVPNQYGQINSFPRIDTGFQKVFDLSQNNLTGSDTVFGGDVFISRFAFKTKLPFFIDNRVGAPPDSDIFFDEIGNIGYPKYWHSARSILHDYTVTTVNPDQRMFNLISTKAHNFDCPNDPSAIPPQTENPVFGSFRTFYDGFMYLFAYGIPNFYCESVYNTDLRQAFNNKEGDFWPHVSSSIPDDWVQEKNVPIAQDNTYYYNVTFSKQNKENVFTQLPPDWIEELCYTYFPFRAIYSDTQGDSADNKVNNWLVYRALSFKDFPQNYGNLTSLDGVMDRAVLARFDNKALLYGKLLTIDTSNPQAAYIGNPRLFDASPPIDFAETDLGYVGSQHKFMLKVPYGSISADAKRGQIFLIGGTKIVDITKFGSGVNRFMTNHLPFEILEYFPDVNIDNHFAGIGLHGVYDSKFDRVIITKLDYIPINDAVYYDSDTNQFFIDIPDDPSTPEIETLRQEVFLFDREYFCSKSWTMSFDFSTKSWISFHSYLPNFYIGENNFYYSGINSCCTQFTAVLETPDRSKIDEEQPQIEMMVGVISNVIPLTTSSSTTSSPLFTSSTTTAYVPDCDFSIALVEELSCEIDGVGYITVPSPTTTTICYRTGRLENISLLEGFEIQSSGTVVMGTGSAEDACAVARVADVGNTSEAAFPIIQNGEITSNETDEYLNQWIYKDNGTIDCTYVSDGWYSTQNQFVNENNVFYVENGRVLEEYNCGCNTTSTTTTIVPFLPECCVSLAVDNNDDLYLLSGGNDANPVGADSIIPLKLKLGGITANNYDGIAWSEKYFFVLNNTDFEIYSINSSPWAVTNTQTVAIPAGTQNPMIAKDDATLITQNSSGNVTEVVIDYDSLTASSTNKFALPAGYVFDTNFIYVDRSEPKLITTGYQSASPNDAVLFEFNYNTGAINLQVTYTGKKVRNIIYCDCNTYLVCDGAVNTTDVFLVSSLSPYELIKIADSVPSAYDDIDWVSQRSSCMVKVLEQTTTTTTTVAPTTTTTSTSAAPGVCNEYEIVGPRAIQYTDCFGQLEIISVPSGDTETVCAIGLATGAGITLIGPCTP
jgi:hypothetical protein